MAESASSKSFNMRNPAVKRILQEVKEMAREQSTEYMSMPLEEDIFEWQFAVHGPKDSEFEGGIYHGRITLPPEYPFKPPSFMLLTPSGRFEVQTKICLSISNHHPEHWQPSWSVRTALVALIAFMPTKPNGAIGSLDYTKKERRALAIKSRQNPPQFGSPDRQRIIQQLHEAMLGTAPPVPTTPLVEDEPSAPSTDYGEVERAPAQQPRTQPQPQENAGGNKASNGTQGSASSSASDKPLPPRSIQSAPEQENKPEEARVAGASSEGVESAHLRIPAVPAGLPADTAAAEQAPPARARPATVLRPAGGLVDSETIQERMLSAIAAILVIAILLILGQKIARAYTGVAFTGGESEL